MARSSVSVISFLAVAAAFVATPASAGSIKVNPGESIQAAVDAASPGDKIVVMPGDYTETHGNSAAIHVTKPLQLLAKSTPDAKVRLLPGPGNTDGVLVEPANSGDADIDGFRIKGFTIEGFPNNGIFLRHVQNFKIDKNESINNLENGIWPTLSANGLVKNNVSYGSEDSALWVEASENVRVLKNEFHHSPTGVEITVSNSVEVAKNDIHHNTVGVGLYHPSAASLPVLPEMDNWEITKNWIHDNNEPNTAPAGSMSGSLPAGGGILALGVDHVVATGNTIDNNDFYGISVVDYCLAVGGTSFDCSLNPPEVEPYPDHNVFQGNVLIDNGTAPDPEHPMAPYAADLTYIVLDQGHINCFAKNEYDTLKNLGKPMLLQSGSCL
jgi:hypothetical protein